MNRHYTESDAKPLGPPIRKAPTAVSPQTPWKTIANSPDYMERFNAQGIREVSHKDYLPWNIK